MQRLRFLGNIWQVPLMKAALLPDRGVVKVAGIDARKFLNGLVTADMGRVTPARPCFAALLTPQGKIIVDFIIADSDAPDGNDFFLDCPRALAGRRACIGLGVLIARLRLCQRAERGRKVCREIDQFGGVAPTRKRNQSRSGRRRIRGHPRVGVNLGLVRK